jgi:pimeloyl-ACP methyl ester carboxylesterase
MPQLPIVLTHGYLGFGTLGPFNYFKDVANVLAQMGAKEVYAVDVPPKGSLADRSSQLAAQIRQHVPSGKVHLIAHSMGGLDSRYLISKGNGRDLVATLTTLGSPFCGTVAADIAADPLRLKQIGVAKLLAAITRFELHGVSLWPFAAPAQIHFALGAFRDAIARIDQSDYSNAATYFRGVFSLDNAALHELTTDNCHTLFPEDENDLAGIPSASYAGVLESAATTPFLSASAIVLDAAGQPNDGLVSVQSASLKNHRGTLPVDHLGLVGWGPKDVSDTFREIYRNLPA